MNCVKEGLASCISAAPAAAKSAAMKKRKTLSSILLTSFLKLNGKEKSG